MSAKFSLSLLFLSRRPHCDLGPLDDVCSPDTAGRSLCRISSSPIFHSLLHPSVRVEGICVFVQSKYGISFVVRPALESIRSALSSDQHSDFAVFSGLVAGDTMDREGAKATSFDLLSQLLRGKRDWTPPSDEASRAVEL
jgi:hypothetical protein